MRQRLAIPFGGGLDRAVGASATDPAHFADLRNVHLRAGKVEQRRGITTLTEFAASSIIGIYPLRSQGVAAVVTYTESTGAVQVYRVLADGSASALAGTLWTLPAGAPRPSIVGADCYGKLYVAHDEPHYAVRCPTRVYDPVAGTIADYKLDLYLPTGLDADKVATKFRGMARYGPYLVGWGYGTEIDGDRPEVLRISLPGVPDVMEPNDYFLCGQRGEAIVAGDALDSRFLAFKRTSTSAIVGKDRATWGVVEIDPDYGAAGPHVSIVTGGVCYFWSHTGGPRVTDGGASRDLAVPLDLANSPSPLAEITDPRSGFAFLRPTRHEVEFIFGRWGYVLALDGADAPEWSMREYGVELACGAVLALEPAAAIAPTAHPEITALAFEGGEIGRATITWTNVSATGGEIAEVWGKARYTTPPPETPPGHPAPVYVGEDGYETAWAVQGTGEVPVAGASQSATYDWFGSGAVSTYAVRFLRGGVPTQGYESSNPSDWPAVSRMSATDPA